MILSDRDIQARLEKGDLVIDPLQDRDLQIQPASVDVRLGHEFVVYQLPNVPYIDTRNLEMKDGYTKKVTVEEDDYFTLHPGEFVLGSTLERVEIPDDLVARVEGRSSIGRLAVVVHATAGFIDPGFEGHVTLELSNLGRVAVELYPRTRISQLVFQQMTSPAARPYGSGRKSKYHGQQGPVTSRIDRDPDMDE